MFTAMIVQAVYGKRVEHLNDGYVMTAQKAVEGLSQTHIPGKFWVEYFPWLRHIPSWVPGSSARKFGEQYYPAVRALRDDRFDVVMNDVVGLGFRGILIHVSG